MNQRKSTEVHSQGRVRRQPAGTAGPQNGSRQQCLGICQGKTRKSKTCSIISHFALTHRMTNSQRLAKVRSSLLKWLANQEPRQENVESWGDKQMSSPTETLVIERESILVREDYFCGRRFYTAHHQAVWFIEEDELKIYRNDGELLCTLSGDEIDRWAGESRSSESADILRLPHLGDPAPDSQDSVRRAA